MTFDAQAIFANLTEKERIHGHHSPEGQAIRALSRALHGWSTGNLSGRDVVVMCDQALEDWLKRRLKVSAWSAIGMTELLAAAAAKKVLPRLDAARLQRLPNLRAQSTDALIAARDVEAALACAIEIVETHWS
ncbi:MAG: hypothetical protein HW419_4450 [Deltaproteobacteria bacterium]|nr:hypothetical protein [Deltaproteobacteria bacterium]